MIRFLHLPAIAHVLTKQAEFVEQAVAVTGIAQAGQRVEKAGGQSSQTAVTESGIRLDRADLFQISPQTGQGFTAGIQKSQIIQAVSQGTPHQELHGEVIQTLCPGTAMALFRLDHAVNQALPDRQ